MHFYIASKETERFMKLIKFIIGSVLLLATIYSCNLIGGHHDHSTTFDYTARDSLGTIVAKGWLTLDLRDPVNVTGHWEIKQVKDSIYIGPQDGQGRLEGSLKNSGDMWIGLNPGYVDNNVFLNGKYENDKYSGKWMFSSFIGLTNWGTYVAVRR